MAREKGATSGGGGGSDPTLTSTLGDIVDTTSPYSFAPTLTHTGTVLTTITRASDDSSVSVAGSTTTTPTATCTAADAALGDSFHCESVATDSGITKTVVTTVFMEGTGGGGGGGWTDILDWSSSSEAFSGGEDTYTIGGLSVVVDWAGTSGPDSIDLTNGVLTVEGDNTKQVYLTIDLGEDFENVPLWATISLSNMANVASTSAVIWQMADDQTAVNAAGHWQELVGLSGANTDILGRYATGTSTFVTTNSRTVTDIETTPTRLAVLIEAVNFKPSFDQGTAALPTTGADLGTVGPNSCSATSGAYTTTAARNQRYMHLRVACDATIELFAAKRT